MNKTTVNKMEQNGTDSGLSAAQELAVNALVAGATVSGAAQRAGVSRGRVYRWLNDPHFVAALNRNKLEIRDALQARLVRLAGQACRTLGKALEAGDAKSALALLAGLGLLPGQQPAAAEIDPEQIIDQLAQRKVEKQVPRIKAKHRAKLPPEQRLASIEAEERQSPAVQRLLFEIARDEVLAELEQQRGGEVE